jgi:hypothetical protein
MKRRNFLKLMGAAFLAPTALVPEKLGYEIGADLAIGKDASGPTGAWGPCGENGATGANGLSEGKAEPPTYYDSAEMLDREGYFYCHIPVSKPITIDPETFNPRKGLLTRYGKKELQEGAKYYARISIRDFKI